MFVEVRKRDKWLLYNHPPINRDYQLFEKMAGVRGEDAKAISPPKGLPSDVSEMVAIEYEYYGTDAHSESYLTEKEIEELEAWYKKITGEYFAFNRQFGYLFGNDFTKRETGLPIDEVRFVFWFDN